MKQFTYVTDRGSIQLGNENFTCNINNYFGDGAFTVVVTEKNELATPLFDNFLFQGTVQGTFNVYGYDCSTTDVLITLTGKYGVFVNGGDVVLEKWE